MVHYELLQLEELCMEAQDIANTFVHHNGEAKNIKQWCKDLNLNYTTVRVRFARGTRGDRLFAPTNTNPKPVDLQMFLGDEIFQQLAEAAAFYQTTPAVLARQIVEKGLRHIHKTLSA